MKLFDDINRKENGPKHFADPHFYYLNHSARSESEVIRKLLELWFAHVPFGDQKGLRSRFRSKDNQQHLGAFFELYIHELLLRLGFDITFHSEIEDKSTHPDFMVSRGEEQQFYLEATLAALSNKEVATKALENQVYDTLNNMKSPNFFLGLKVQGAPATLPTCKKIRDFLESKLADLDPDEVAEQLKTGSLEAFSWEWEHGDWRITFFPIPKSLSQRGKSGIRPIGLQMQESISLTPDISIRDSIHDKASKYGRLNLPYVIAMNILDEYDVDESDISIGLFGKEPITAIFPSNYSQETHLNAAWYGPDGPRHQRVSGALIAVNLNPWSIAKVTPVLWHNPWANYPLPQDIWQLPQLVPGFVDNQPVKNNGNSIWELLGLYPDWPKACNEV